MSETESYRARRDRIRKRQEDARKNLGDIRNEMFGVGGGGALAKADKVRATMDLVFNELQMASLEEHSLDLVEAANASDEYAKKLVGATDRLGYATWALVLATIALIFITWIKG